MTTVAARRDARRGNGASFFDDVVKHPPRHHQKHHIVHDQEPDPDGDLFQRQALENPGAGPRPRGQRPAAAPGGAGACTAIAASRVPTATYPIEPRTITPNRPGTNRFTL